MIEVGQAHEVSIVNFLYAALQVDYLFVAVMGAQAEALGLAVEAGVA
jgi:hypothetical protein